MGDIPSNVYTSQNKKNFVFTMLFESIILLCFFGYFLCVTAAYSEDMHGPEQPEEEAAAPVGSVKASSKPPSAQSKKSKEPSQKADEPAADAPAEDGAGDAAA
jgi:hypothetical protein